MDVPAVTSTTTNTTGSAAARVTPLAPKTLTQEDFLKLLVAQLSAQDPLNPQTDTQFIAQMAQFSALEQSKSMQSDIAQLRSQQELLQANALLGRTVAVQADPLTVAQGTVSAVQVEAGTPKLIVNGLAYDLSELLTITPGTTQ
jgi:flagellar basal-body rod modification protein FlgD